MTPSLRYLLITPTKNEEEHIEATIKSVVAQTHRPTRFLVVSDGSTDRTDEIVEHYVRQHDWIELYRRPVHESRDFAGKAHCVNSGYARLKRLDHDLVVSLDSDITFEPDYFEFLIGKFEANPRLGVGGTPFSENGQTYDYHYTSLTHVSGACQVFRRECFEQIGGYTPVQGGGIDVIAVLLARMKGWQTRTFIEKTCEHHRPMGSATAGSEMTANFRLGERGYRLGFHPLWQVFRSVYQMTRKPYMTAGAALFAGYFWAMLRRVPRPIGPDVISFQRRDQMRRLRAFLHLGARTSPLL
jgi:glycosyltransferase involved in cell wall biosynthesis